MRNWRSFQRPTSNIQRPTSRLGFLFVGHWLLDVGRWAFDSSFRSAQPPERRQGGSALIVVLWVIGLLGMLVASFAFEARIEARITSYNRNRTKADYLARSGLAIAELLMSKVEDVAGTDEADAPSVEQDPWFSDAKSLADGGEVVVEHDLADAGVGEGVIRVRIVPEPARINVNTLVAGAGELSDQLWEGILEVAGVPEEMWSELIDSFYDWTDTDEAPRVDGAESDDYYANLDEPYTARNGPLDTVGELLLIKGFTKEILDGGTLHEGTFDDEQLQCTGIRDMLTTYGGKDGKPLINVNAASARVLMALPGVDADIAQLIIEERSGWTDELGVSHDETFEDVGDFSSRIPNLGATVKSLVSTQSAIYRVTSTGEINGVPRSLWCIVRYSGDELTILRWREDD
jgi:general secretion pathway protein K